MLHECILIIWHDIKCWFSVVCLCSSHQSYSYCAVLIPNYRLLHNSDEASLIAGNIHHSVELLLKCPWPLDWQTDILSMRCRVFCGLKRNITLLFSWLIWTMQRVAILLITPVWSFWCVFCWFLNEVGYLRQSKSFLDTFLAHGILLAVQYF